LKFAIKIVIWVLLIGGVAVLYAFTNKASDDMICKDVIINIDNDNNNYFVDAKDILQMSYQRGDSLKGQSMQSINVYSLENTFNSHPSIKSTEVYKTINGELYINVIQRKPICRIINYKGEGYYFDAEGKLMPLSENYSARVPVFTGLIPFTFGGNYNRDFRREFECEDSLDMDIHLLNSIYHLAAYIDSSEFWQAQIEQVNIVDNDFVLIPKVGDNKIIFGDAKNTANKFNRLMTFYTEGLSKTGWNKYSIINLKFENQVVCTKANVPLIATIVREIEPIAKETKEVFDIADNANKSENKVENLPKDKKVEIKENKNVKTVKVKSKKKSKVKTEKNKKSKKKVKNNKHE